jgi:parallel beta-helix repeat protein
MKITVIKRLVLAAGICASLSAEVAWAQLTIHVTSAANPQTSLADLKKNPDAPVNLTQALAILKDPSLRDAKGILKESITIKLDAGTYHLGETINIDTASSGDAEHPVTIEGPKDASAIISGGRSVSSFTPVTDRAILARLPEAARSHVLQANLAKQGISDYGKQARHGIGKFNVPTALEVSYRNQPMALARWPNRGFAKIDTLPDGEKGLSFTVKDANLQAWRQEPDLIATGYWFYNWADTTIPLKAIDLATHRITLTEPAPTYGLKIGQLVFFQNILAELDQPGEWYLDKAHGLLYFWPPESLHENEVEVSTLEKLLTINNASYIKISGITFQNARGDAIIVRGGQHVSIDHSVIRNIGNRAAVISGGQDNGLTDMLIEDIGEGGVVLSGGDRQTLTSTNLYVEGSTIRRFGRVSRAYQAAVMLDGVGNRATGNKISDAPHTAIMFAGNDHLITHNEIYDVCKDADDAGAIYTDRDWTGRGTVISENYLHDFPTIANAVYLDDQSSGIIVRNNRFENLRVGVFLSGGRDNLVEGNTFKNVVISLHLDARGKTWEKAMTEDKNGQFQKALRSVPYNLAPYNRYPHLANILEDELGAPKYNVYRRNQVIGNARLDISKDAEAGISIEDK